MSVGGVRPLGQGLHRGTDLAVATITVLGGMTLTMLPMAVVTELISPVPVAAWREVELFVSALLVGTAMLVLARALRRRRGWARPVGMLVLMVWTLACGGLVFLALRMDDPGVDASGYMAMSGSFIGVFCFAGVLGLLTRGAAADFERNERGDVVLPKPPPPLG